MKPKFILCFALVLIGGLLGCSRKDETTSNQASEPVGKLYEIFAFHDRPLVMIYMRGFVDMAFNAYIRDGESEKLLFRSLPAMTSQFESLTNPIVRDNHAKRISADRNGVGMYDVFWSKDSRRLAIVFMGNFIAGYDCQTGQKIQITDCQEDKSQCTAIGAVIKRFLDGETITDAQVAEVRNQSYSNQQNPATP